MTDLDKLDALAAAEDAAILAVASVPECEWQAEHERDIRFALGPDSQCAATIRDLVAENKALREAAKGILSYPGPVNVTEEVHAGCEPDDCYVTALRAALHREAEASE